MSRRNTDQTSDATRLVNAGRSRDLTGNFVNPPVIHASTVLFDSVEQMSSGKATYTYARRGTPTSVALETAIADLDRAAGAVLTPSGLSALTTAFLAFLSTGDHILLPDSIYGPTRAFADTVLKRIGVAVTYYDPAVGGDVARLMTAKTRVIHVESPGSQTFEMQDIPAIAETARATDAIVTVDNSWATPLFCRPLSLGADVVITAATKYIGGHADIMLGAVSANERCWKDLKATHGSLGLCVGPDDAYMALRGLRTMKVRVETQMRSALTVARWLQGHPEVARVLHPALPEDPGHALWRRDMTGSTGLFGFVLKGWTADQAARFLDGLELFGMGYSWGGFESLIIPADHGLVRTAKAWHAEGPLIRIHIGLEDPADLIEDLGSALTKAKG